MGANNGTGQPHFFVCPVERSTRIVRILGPHRVELTGRTRDESRLRRKHGRGGGRMSRTSREYRCLTCGHVGWSAHVDLERRK